MIIDTRSRKVDYRLAAPVELLGIPLEDNDEICHREPERYHQQDREVGDPNSMPWNRDFSFCLSPNNYVKDLHGLDFSQP